MKDTRTVATQLNTPKDTTRPLSTENKPKEKAENRPWRPKGPKEYASGKNEKGERIYYIYRSTGHLANFHKKDDKGDAEQKKPSVHVVKAPTTNRKKGQERMAERA